MDDGQSGSGGDEKCRDQGEKEGASDHRIPQCLAGRCRVQRGSSLAMTTAAAVVFTVAFSRLEMTTEKL